MFLFYATILFIIVVFIASFSKFVYGKQLCDLWEEDMNELLEALGIATTAATSSSSMQKNRQRN